LLAGIILFLVLQAVGGGGDSSYTLPPPQPVHRREIIRLQFGVSPMNNTTHIATLQSTIN
jgi:hypothetical protein